MSVSAIIKAIISLGNIVSFLKDAWAKIDQMVVEGRIKKKKKKRDEAVRQIQVETQKPIEEQDIEKLKDLHRRLRSIES
jgi:hypothetical protein